MTRQMHLNAFLIYTPMIHAVGSWALPGNEIVSRFTTPEIWQEAARALEDGLFDMAFLGDHMAPYDVYAGDAQYTIEKGLQFPVHDPVTLVPWMAAVTKHLGFGVTMSTSFYQPYLLTRKLSTLDHLTRGRMAWNVVMSAQENEARNMGLGAMLPHDERYDRADEYMAVCNALWSSWDDDAIVARSEDMVFIDPERVHSVEHEGKYFSIHSPANVCPSPQRRPVIMQAGSSPRGRDFAAEHAEVIFAIQRTAEDMRAFVDDMERRAAKFGRRREDFKVVFGAQPIIGETHSAAEDLRDTLLDLAQVQPSLAKFCGMVGIDLSTADLDAPLADVNVPGAQGLVDMFTKTRGDVLTLRDAARAYGVSAGNPQFVGTGIEIAEQMQDLFERGGGDGFNLTPPVIPTTLRAFSHTVVPTLQSMGIFRTAYEPGTLRERLFGRSM